MRNTTPTLESINVEALLFVSGGCHKRHCCCPQQQQQQQCIINMPPAQQASQMLPQVAQPQPQPQPDPGFGGFPQTTVSTNVSINGQPIAGQGQPTATA
jgi:hypothetical protein